MLAKPRLLKAINFKEEDFPVEKALDGILHRENRDFSSWGVEAAKQYIKVHGDGNPQYTLDTQVVAYPTAWKKESFVLTDYTDDDLKEMLELLEQHRQEVRAVINQRIASRGPSVPKERVYCKYCGRPILGVFTLDDHYNGQWQCREAAKREEAGLR